MAARPAVRHPSTAAGAGSLWELVIKSALGREGFQVHSSLLHHTYRCRRCPGPVRDRESF